MNRKEVVGFGCVPRLEDARVRELPLNPELKKIYSNGMVIK